MTIIQVATVWHKILTGEKIDKFEEFPAVRQYFPYQIYHLVRHLLLIVDEFVVLQLLLK